MSNPTADITRIIRRVRGGSQAYLVQASDKRFYVAKFTGNPQGTRTLINEWIASKIICSLQIATPLLTLLHLRPEVMFGGESPCFEVGNTRIPVSPGLHLGSLCPVNPENTAIFDFLPGKMLQKTANLSDFAKMIALDILLGQADSRQAVFVRDRSNRRLLFGGYMIDNGMIFGGSKWELLDWRGQGLYFDRKIYSMTNTGVVCDQTVQQLEACITEESLFDAAKEIPDAWFAPGDYDMLAMLFLHLLHRKGKLSMLVRNQFQELGLDFRHEASLSGSQAREISIPLFEPRMAKQSSCTLIELE